MKTQTLLSLLVLLGLSASGRADEAAGILKRARAIEVRAEKLLDQGRRAAAFQLLGQVADLRERARTLRHGPVKPVKTAKPAKKADGAKAKPAATPKAKRAPRTPNLTPKQALVRFDAALRAQDMGRARREAAITRAVLARWAARLRQREQTLENRLQKLEKQIAELKKLLR